MVQAVVVNKTGKCIEVHVDHVNELYKKCGYKKMGDFIERHSWPMNINGDACSVSVYARTIGQAGMENKYELPPPVDKALYFGKLGIILNRDNTLDNLSVTHWKEIYNKLYGGFEDLSKLVKEDDEEEDELDEYPEEMKTAEGYLKDDFVVSDDELEEESYVFSEEDT